LTRVAAERSDTEALVLLAEINRANPDSAETPLGSHAGWGGTTRPFGRSDDPISDTGTTHLRSLTILAGSTEREENRHMSLVSAKETTSEYPIEDLGGVICLESTV
jgi:hypothetical protein